MEKILVTLRFEHWDDAGYEAVVKAIAKLVRDSLVSRPKMTVKRTVTTWNRDVLHDDN